MSRDNVAPRPLTEAKNINPVIAGTSIADAKHSDLISSGIKTGEKPQDYLRAKQILADAWWNSPESIKLRQQASIMENVLRDWQNSPAMKAVSESKVLKEIIANRHEAYKLPDHIKELQAQQAKLTLLNGGLSACDAVKAAQSAAQLLSPVRQLSNIQKALTNTPRPLSAELTNTFSREIKKLEDNSDSTNQFSSTQVFDSANALSVAFMSQVPSTLIDMSKNIISIQSAVVRFSDENRNSIDSLTEISKNNADCTQKQLEEISKLLEVSRNTRQEAQENAVSSSKQNEISLKRSKIAIWISVVSVIVTLLISAFTCYIAHHDSDSTTQAILKGQEQNSKENSRITELLLKLQTKPQNGDCKK